MTKKNEGRSARFAITAVIAAVALSACDILTVSDPQRYTASDLDQALPAVANGVEGAVQEVIDSWVVYNALLGDTYQHTGTWAGYDETDHGRFQYATSQMDGTQNALLRARWFAGDAEERFERVLEGAAATSELMAQVHMSEAMADLYIGMAFCESPAVADGPAVSDMAILQQAVEKFTKAIATAQSAGTNDYLNASYGGRATANMLLGNYTAASADAGMVPDGYSYEAIFNQQSLNSIVQLTTKGFNEAGGLMYKWWDMIDNSGDKSSYFHDPLTGDFDTRLPVWFDGEIATDNETPHYSQYKYDREISAIPMIHSDGMKLIQAEALVMSNDFAGATDILNDLRAAVGLGPHDVPTSMDGMMDILLWERFAEHFMEGMRMIDLHRFDMVAEVFGALNDGAGDPERPANGRPTQFSLTDTEPTYNAQITNDLASRCLPKT